jgi:hypothetical protein
MCWGNRGKLEGRLVGIPIQVSGMHLTIENKAQNFESVTTYDICKAPQFIVVYRAYVMHVNDFGNLASTAIAWVVATGLRDHGEEIDEIDEMVRLLCRCVAYARVVEPERDKRAVKCQANG